MGLGCFASDFTGLYQSAFQHAVLEYDTVVESKSRFEKPKIQERAGTDQKANGDSMKRIEEAYMSDRLFAKISRDFLAMYRVPMIKAEEMDDFSVIRACHLYCEENHLSENFEKYRESAETEYVYCAYLRDYIPSGCCYDMQMIRGGYIKPSALSDIPLDRDISEKYCVGCKHQL